MTGAIEEQLAALDQMSSVDLKSRWTRLIGTPAPRISPKLMRLALAWEIQASVTAGSLVQRSSGSIR